MSPKALKIYRLRPRQTPSSGSTAGPVQTQDPGPSTSDSTLTTSGTLASSQTSSEATQTGRDVTSSPVASDSSAPSSAPQNSATLSTSTSDGASTTDAGTSPSSPPGSSSTSASDSSSSGSTSGPTSGSTSSPSPSPSTSSSTSSSQSTSSSASSSPSSSTIQSTSSTTQSSSTSSTTDSSTSTSSPLSTTSTTATSSPDSTSSGTSTTPASDTSVTSDSSTGLTTITSSFVTTIDGHATTVVTAFPTTYNSAPTNSSGQRTGMIAGSAIGATLLVLLLLAGLFLYHRRKARRKISLAHRALPAPRSALLAGEDDFDLAGPSPPMGEGVPTLLRPRGQETGSIFHEGVWPPPGERSRLEDPLLAGSNVDLTSIVDSVMGGEGHQHERSSSASSNAPLLASTVPTRSGKASPSARPSAFASLASQSTPRERSQLSRGSEPWEMTPLNPSGHAPQYSMDGSQDYDAPRPDSDVLPPGAAPPQRTFSGSPDPAMTPTGSPRPEVPHLRGGAGFGSLMVVNSTPDTEQENPLVDLTPGNEEPPQEIPPLYHMIRRDTNDTWRSMSEHDQTSNTDAQSPQSLVSPGNVGRAL